MNTILCADIGGTNSRFAWFRLSEGRLAVQEIIKLPTAETESFGDLLDDLRASQFGFDPADCDIAVIAVCGAVKKGVMADPANVSWAIDVSNADKDYGLKKCFLVNDFVAQAYACVTPAVDNALEIKPGTPNPTGALAAIGAGTGLGHGAIRCDRLGGYTQFPSEAGHATFAFYTEEEIEYMRFVQAETGKPYPYGDLIVTGLGLTLLHKFHTGRELEPAEVAKELPDSPDTRTWYARFYGRACRNYAITVLPTAGLYIAGGIAAKNPFLVTDPAFTQEFLFLPHYKYILEPIPIYLNSNDDSGLWGAARFGQQVLATPGAFSG